MKQKKRTQAQVEASRRNGRKGGRPRGIGVLNVKTSKVEQHSVNWLLAELNRNRPASWIKFTKKDWRIGWEIYIDKRQYILVDVGNKNNNKQTRRVL